MVIRSLSGVQPNISPDDLPLQLFYLRERTMADRIYLTQPYDGGKIRHYTWAEVGDEVRRMASFLKAQDWPAGSRIGILGKNSAGWIMCDLAIWMAGRCSVTIAAITARSTSSPLPVTALTKTRGDCTPGAVSTWSVVTRG